MSRRGSVSAAASSHVDSSFHPGFINLGNTCFLNSVLQATSATQSLKQLLHPEEVLDEDDLEILRSQNQSVSTSEKGPVYDLLSSELIKQLSARSKSPVLQLVDEEHRKAYSLPGSRRPSTNLDKSLIASTLSGVKNSDDATASTTTSARSSMDARSYEPTSGDLPLTTAFRQVLEKAWTDQDRSSSSKGKASRRAPAINPKRLLNVMSSKYDQYGEYGQQDGHELLRHLLDSLRMEELDVIKKLQPSSPKMHKRRIRRASTSDGHDENSEKQMQPFVDNIFCGKRDRMRSMADRWRRATTGKPVNGSSSKMTAGDSLAMMTDGLMGSVSDTEEVEEKVKRSSSRSGRSITRPKSAAAGQNPAIIDANSRDSAKTFMMKNFQPKEAAQDPNELEIEKMNLGKEKEEEKRGATSLLRAVSTRSRPSSRASSPIREEIREVVEGDQPHHHHHPHLLRHDRKPKQSKQGAYLARLLTEATPPAPLTQTSALLWGRKITVPITSDARSDGGPNLSGSSDQADADIETQQASTGLVRALYQFTSVEVLDGPNSFACKRCWRILNPPSAAEKEKFRLRRLRRGKEQDESEESSDDETSSDEEAKEQKQLEDEASSQSASVTSSLGSSVLQNGKVTRPSINPHADWTKTVTPHSARQYEIPTIETTSPQTPIDDKGTAAINGITSKAPLLQAPKARVASNQGITLGEPLSSASSEDELSDNEKDAKEPKEIDKSRHIKFGEEATPIKSNGQSLLALGKGVVRKRSIHSLQRRALKRFLIAETPRVFVFHFKRFQASSRGFSSYSFSSSFKKIDDYVSFPEYLDVRPWLAPPREEYNREGQLKLSSDPRALNRIHREEAEETQMQEREKRQHRWGWRSRIPVRGSEGKVQDGEENETKTKYRLYAVIVHQGSMSGGHYTAYVLSDHANGPTMKSSVLPNLKALQSSQTPTASSTPVPVAAKVESKTAPVSEASSPRLGGHSTQVVNGSSHTSNQSLSSLSSAENSKGNASDLNTSAAASETEISEERKSSVTSLGSSSANKTAQSSQSTTTTAARKDNRRWIYTSDTVVRGATIEEVLKAQAYMLFYEQM